MINRLLLAAFLLWIGPAQAQQTQCLNPPVGTKSANCASQEFVTDSIAAIPAGGDVTGPGSSTAGHVATFADTTGKIIQDGGSPAAGTVTSAGNGLSLTGGGTTLGINPPVSTANGGSGVVSPTAHTVPVNEGASAQANTGVGLTGQVLAGNTAADPTFQSGSRILLATLSCPNSGSTSCQDTTHITTTYNEYEIVLENVAPATNAVTCELQVHQAAGFITSGYLGQISVFSATTNTVQAATTFLPCSLVNATGNSNRGVSGSFRVYGNVGNSIPNFTGQFAYSNNTGVNSGAVASGFVGSSFTMDGFQLIFSTGNIASGTIKIYGML